ncbi:MAG: trypsin-like peptidase domain-containing protein, partial [Rhodothermia bacterium]
MIVKYSAMLAFVLGVVSTPGESYAQLHFLSSLDRNVAAVGESFVLTVELLATPTSDEDLDRYRQAFASIDLELPDTDLELVRSLRSRERMSFVEPHEVLQLTRKYVLKARRPGRVEVPPIVLPLAGDRYQAGLHDLLAYGRDGSLKQVRRSILPLTVESDIGDNGLRRFVGYGSSFLVAEDALVTAFHVVVNARKIHVTLPNGRRLSLKKVWAVDPGRDVVVLKIDPDEIRKAGLTPLQIEPRDFETSRRGFPGEPEIVFTGGWPKGVQSTQAGVLFAVNQYYDDEAIWLSSNAVKPGDSGGPLLNENGQVIGVVSYAMSGRRSGMQVLENVTTSTDPRPAVARSLLRRTPDNLSRYRRRMFFERNPHAMAAKVAALLAEFGSSRNQSVLGGVDPFLRQLDQAVTSRHGEARLHFLQGSVYQMLGEYSDASSAYKEALLENTDHYPAAYSLAYCNLALRSYETAASLFDFITHFEPYENLALYGLAQAEMQLLRYDRAIEHLRKVIHDHPDFATGLYLLGRAYLGAGEEELAS